MTLLSIVQRAAALVALPVPTSVIGNTDQTVQQLLAISRTGGEEMLKWGDWVDLISGYIFTTTDGVNEYVLPSDYDRQIDSTVWSNFNRWPYLGPVTPQEWQALVSAFVGAGVVYPRYRIVRETGGVNKRFYIYPTPGATADTVAYQYITKNWVIDADSQALPTWENDDDTSVFPESLLILDLRWRWLQSRGFSYDVQLAEFEQARDREFAQERPAPVLCLNPTYVGPRMVDWFNVPGTNISGI
ncbi:MAG: hypothetical protein AB7I33_12705 [Gemmatimonadales bacterium]